jgi:AbiU2
MTLETGNPEITDLRDMVTAAHKEIDMAVAFHEVWKPAAYDRDLHARMGKSYATHAFRITAIGLRREMLLALARLWDTYKYEPTIRMTWIAHTLRDDRILDALAAERVSSAGLPEAFDDMRADLAKRACEVVQLVRKYLEGGSRKAVLDKLLTLRHEELAHRRVAPSEATGANATDEEIEEFYRNCPG